MPRDGADSDWAREHGFSGAYEDPDSYFENVPRYDDFAPRSCEDVFFASFEDAKRWAIKHPGSAFVRCPFGHGYVPKNSSAVPRGLNSEVFEFLRNNLDTYFCEPITKHDFTDRSNPKVPDTDISAVYEAAKAGDLPRLKQCLRASAFKYDPWSHGHMIQSSFNHALEYSAQYGHMSPSQWLVENGADSLCGLKPSLEYGNFEIFDWLIENGPDIPSYAGLDELIAAQRCNDIERCKRIIERGASSFTAALFSAAGAGATAFCALYIRAGANLNAVSADEDFYSTPLIWAVKNGHFETCRLLIDYGANVNSPEDKGMSSRPLAYAKNGSEIHALLLAHGAK